MGSWGRRVTTPARLVGLAVAVGLAACGEDDGGAVPDTTTSSVATTTTSEVTTTTTADEEPVVLAAYQEAWAVYPAFLNGERPETELATYFAGERLENIPAFIAEFRDQAKRLEGQVLLEPGSVTVFGDRALFVDCMLDQATQVAVATGEVLVPAAALPQAVDVEMLRVDGEWKLARVVFGEEGTCTRRE